jgi:hypothetical protein
MGPQGPTGVSGYQVVETPGPVQAVAVGGLYIADALCPSGKVPLSGGYDGAASGTQLSLIRSAPLSSGTGWRVVLRNNTASNVSSAQVRVSVVCATVNP